MSAAGTSNADLVGEEVGGTPVEEPAPAVEVTGGGASGGLRRNRKKEQRERLRIAAQQALEQDEEDMQIILASIAPLLNQGQGYDQPKH
jgi:hypothetical protein